MSYNSKYKGSEVEELLDSIGNKVDKVDGKQLSTEDFTTLLKEKLDGLSNYDDTAIQASISKLRTDLDTLVSGDTTTAIKTFNEVIAFLDGLEDTEDLASIIASIEQQIAAKASQSDIPTKVGELENDMNYVVDSVIANGVYIQDVEGNLFGIDEWDSSLTPNGIAVIGDKCSFVMALQDAYTGSLKWDSNVNLDSYYQPTGGVEISGIATTTDAQIAMLDYKGSTNTKLINDVLGENNSNAAWKCSSFVFPKGDDGYLGAAGEWLEVSKNIDDINSALTKCGGVSLNDSYWTSTQYSAMAGWYMNLSYETPSSTLKNGSHRARAFSTMPKNPTILERIERLEASGGSGAYAEVNHGTSDTTFTLTPNTFHVWDKVASLDLSFGAETSGVANEYLFQFTSGATATTLTLPSDIKWANDTAPTISRNMIYQISVLKGLASVLEFSNAAALIMFYVRLEGSYQPFQCEPGMTWQDFVNSEYNNETYILAIYGSNVGWTSWLITDAAPSDVIVEGAQYTTYYND